MRIVWTPPPRPSATRREDRAGASSDNRFTAAVANDAPAPPAAPPRPPGPVEGLFALQEVSDALTGRRRAIARGHALLDRLDDLRLALLSGAMPRENLRDLARLASESRSSIGDPRLAAILDEIELRVAVELAKLGEPV